MQAQREICVEELDPMPENKRCRSGYFMKAARSTENAA
jgi:hypothetical protein